MLFSSGKGAADRWTSRAAGCGHVSISDPDAICAALESGSPKMPKKTIALFNIFPDLLNFQDLLNFEDLETRSLPLWF